MTRYTICQQLISILHLLPTHVNEFSSFPDWVDMFLWLLTPFSGPQEDGEGGAQEKEEKEKSCYSSLVEREGDVPAVKVECVGGEGAVTGGGEMEGFPPYRQRLSAFVNSPLPSAAHDDITPRCSSSGRQPRCELTSSTHTEGEDVWQTFHIVTETVGYILWHSVDYERHRAPWKVWGSVLSSVDSFTSSRPLLLPAYLVKQRYLILLYLSPISLLTFVFSPHLAHKIALPSISPKTCLSPNLALVFSSISLLLFVCKCIFLITNSNV